MGLIGKTWIILQLNCDRTCGPPDREENRHDHAPMHGSATAWAEGPQSAATARLGLRGHRQRIANNQKARTAE